MTFWGGAMFQWVNVKGWVAIIGTVTAYAAIARFPLNSVIQGPDLPGNGHGLDHHLDAVR